jgi:5-formyltetrahydrofolate cyclo-ligase
MKCGGKVVGGPTRSGIEFPKSKGNRIMMRNPMGGADKPVKRGESEMLQDGGKTHSPRENGERERMIREKKRLIREKIKKVRSLLKPGEIRTLSLRIIGKLKTLDEFQNAKTVMLYFPVNGEVDILPLLEELVKKKTKTVLLPKVTRDNDLIAVEVTDISILKPGKFGIPEPIGGKIYKPEKIDVVIVPGVAFDEKCNRLGMGKGFYDRFLPRVKGKKIGVAYDFQILHADEFPKEEHDVQLDMVVTPTKIYKREE